MDGIDYTTVLHPEHVKNILSSTASDNYMWRYEIDRALNNNKEEELYEKFVNKLDDDKYGRFISIRAYISFRRFDRGYVNYDQLTQIARKEGFTHQMKNIYNPNTHNVDTIMTDDDLQNDVKALVQRVLSVSRKLYEEKMRTPHARRSR